MHHRVTAPMTGRARTRMRAASVATACILAELALPCAASAQTPVLGATAFDPAPAADPVPATADLAIRSSAPQFHTAGDTVLLAIQLINNGPGIARDIVVSDRLNGAARFLSASRGGTETDGVVSWPAITRLDPGHALSLFVRVRALASDSEVGALEGRLNVTSATPDPATVNNSALASTAILAAAAAAADIAVQLTGPPAVDHGGILTWTLRVTNKGTDPAIGVRVSDQLPGDATFLDATPAGTLAGSTITWSLTASLGIQDTATFQIRAVAPMCGTTLTNRASATAASPIDPDPANNSATVQTRLEGPACPTTSADLRILKSAPPTAQSGDTIVYSISVHNAGPDAASDVLIRDVLPAMGTFVSADAGGSPVGAEVVWPSIASLPALSSVTREVRFVVEAPADRCPVVVNLAAVTSGPDTDPNPGNNTSVAATRVTGPACTGADLEILKEGPPTLPRQPLPDSFFYRLRVRNLGPDTARGVRVRDLLPAAGTFVRADSATVRNGEVEWPERPFLAPGDSLVFGLWYRWPLDTSTVASISNTAFVLSDPVPGDPNPANDTSRITTSSSSRFQDLAVLKLGPATAAAGDTLTYSVLVSNAGDTAIPAVFVTDSLPVNALFIDASGGPTVGGGVVRWVVGLLTPGDTVRYTVRVRAPPAACGGVLTNVALVSPSPDDVPANDRSEVVTAVEGGSCVRVEMRKSASPGVFRVGAVDTFRVTVANVGFEDAGPLTVVDTLAAGLAWEPGEGAGWQLSEAGGVVSASYPGILSPADTASFLVLVRVTSDARPEVCNRAHAVAIGSGGPDMVASICVPVEAPKLLLAKSASRHDAEIGDVVDYRLEVALLDGGLPAVVVRDVLPPGFRYETGSARLRGGVVAEPAGAPGSELTFQVGPMSAGDTVVVTYRVRIGAGARPGAGINRATASGGGEDSPEASDVVEVRPGPFSDEGMIVGKVFADSGSWSNRAADGCDCDWAGDLAQSPDEAGIAGVRVLLQDGTAAITDRDGKFLFYGLTPRAWVVKIDRSTLPPGAVLLPLSNRHARDGASLLVDLTAGELHRADFAIALADTVLAAALRERAAGAAAMLAGLETGPAARFGARGATLPVTVYTEYRPLLPASLGPVLEQRFRGSGAPDPVTAGAPAASGAPSLRASLESREPGHLAIGLLEGRLDLRSLTDARLTATGTRDRFEERLRNLRFSSDSGRVAGGARAALFYRGDFRDGTALTLRLDTEKDPNARLFRDIRPDASYPVWGDASIREFDAASSSRVFGRLERGASFLAYGDFNTAAGFGQTGSRALGDYGRTLTGAVEHFENSRAAITAFASRDRSRQVVDVIPGAGISGPYPLSRADARLNSEQVRLVTRDRNQPAVILQSRTLERFTDYTVEPFTGRILFRRPVPALDDALNPVEIRVTYEVDATADRFWVFGANGQLRPAARLEIGGGFVRDGNPFSRFDLASINATFDLGAGTWITGEIARTDSATISTGDAARLEFRHIGPRLAARAFFLDSDPEFANPSSAFGTGRRETGLLGTARLGTANTMFTEFLRTEDRETGRTRTGGRLGLGRELSTWLSGRIGFRLADETGGPDPAEAGTRALGARLSAVQADSGRGSLFAEFEQDVAEADRRRAELGADYRVLEGVRLYARHELLSSLAGPYDPYPGVDRNSTVLGVAAEDGAGRAAFSEYRIAEASSGREAQAAVGLRNRWDVGGGVRFGASLERLAPVRTGGRSATALTGSAEFTGAPDWKGSTRLEFRQAEGTDNLFGSVGYARRLSSDFTLLGSSLFSTRLGGGDRAFERTRLGIAWRETAGNRWNGLARYEHRYDRNPEAEDTAVSRSAHVLAAHLDFRPDPRLVLRGQWATKFAWESSHGIDTRTGAHLLGLRATADLTSRLDAGLIGRALSTGGRAETRYGAGAELGLRLASGIRIAAGYNVFGFHDRDLSTAESTDRGLYINFDMTFDEGVLREGTCPCAGGQCGTGTAPFCGEPPDPPVRPFCGTCPGCAGCPTCPQCGQCPSCGKADLAVEARGPESAAPGNVVEYRLVTRNHGVVAADSTGLLVSLPPGVELAGASGEWVLSGSAVTWQLGSLGPEAADTVRLAARVMGPVPETRVLEARVWTVTPETSLADNRGAERTRVRGGVVADTADAHVTISGPSPVLRGDRVGYAIAVGNQGPHAARAPVVRVVFPPGAVFADACVNLRDAADDSLGPCEAGPDLLVSDGELVWIRPAALAAGGGHDTIRVTLEAPDTAAVFDDGEWVMVLSASVRTSTYDWNPENDAQKFSTRVDRPQCEEGADVDLLRVGCPADLMVSLYGPQAADPDSVVGYRVLTTNIGNRTALRDTLRVATPANSTVDSAGPARRTPVGGEPEPRRRGPAAEAGGLPPWVPGAEYLEWPIVPAMQPGDTVWYVFRIRAPSSAGLMETEAWTGTASEEPNKANNYTRFPTLLRRRPPPPPPPPDTLADLVVSVNGPDSALVGTTVRYRLTARNLGPAPAQAPLITGIPTGRVVAAGEGADPLGPTWPLPDLGASDPGFTTTVDIACPSSPGRIELEVRGTTTSLEPPDRRFNQARKGTFCHEVDDTLPPPVDSTDRRTWRSTSGRSAGTATRSCTRSSRRTRAACPRRTSGSGSSCRTASSTCWPTGTRGSGPIRCPGRRSPRSTHSGASSTG